MESLRSSKKFLLEKGFQECYEDCKLWKSQIELWKIELNLFQRLLEKCTLELSTVEQKKEIDHFHTLVKYYRGELLNEFMDEVNFHEKNLIKVLYKEAKPDDSRLGIDHKLLARRVNTFMEEFSAYKNELSRFMESV